MTTTASLIPAGAARRLRVTLVLLPFAIACGGGSGGGGNPGPTAPPPVESECLSLAGAWRYEWAMPPCGDGSEGEGTLAVAQDQCAVTVAVPGLGTFQGRLSGNQQQENFDLAFDPGAPGAGTGCGESGEAGLQQPATTTSLQFLFGEGGTQNCCRHGSLTLAR